MTKGSIPPPVKDKIEYCEIDVNCYKYGIDPIILLLVHIIDIIYRYYIDGHDA